MAKNDPLKPAPQLNAVQPLTKRQPGSAGLPAATPKPRNPVLAQPALGANAGGRPPASAPPAVGMPPRKPGTPLPQPPQPNPLARIVSTPTNVDPRNNPPPVVAPPPTPGPQLATPTPQPQPAPQPAPAQIPQAAPQPAAEPAAPAPGVGDLAVLPPEYAFDRVPGQAELDGMPPNARVNTPFGTVTRGADGKGVLVLNEAGKKRYAEEYQRTKKSFGWHLFSDNPNAPQPRIRVGRRNLNPFQPDWENF
jgi:hypothetical protein